MTKRDLFDAVISIFMAVACSAIWMIMAVKEMHLHGWPEWAVAGGSAVVGYVCIVLWRPKKG